MKNHIKTLSIAIFFGFIALMPAAPAEAATSYQSTAAVQARLSALVAELQYLQAQLAALQGVSTVPTYSTSQCYRDTYGNQYCAQPTTPIYTGTNTLRSVDVDFDNDFARVEIEYTTGRNQEIVLGGVDDQDEVIEFIMDETNATRNQVLAVIDWNGDLDNDDNDSEDIDSIDVDINNGDADVRVEYEDGDTDRFTIDNETNRNDIIEEIADELDIDEDDVEDVIDFDNDNNNDEDVDRIVVTIDEDDNDATARVYYEDGDTDTFDYDEDDEDDIIEELADELDMDEDDVEDITDFRYVN